MTLEHDIETINEYTQWKAVRQDTSPEAFVKDRAQQTAYERLTAAIEYIQELERAYGRAIGDFEMHKIEVGKIYLILNGDV